jgi:hypothetical protein
MLKLEDVHYLREASEAKPDANCFLRFPTVYLSAISEDQLQTTDGVVLLSRPYQGPKLAHHDRLMVLARCIQQGRFEGTVLRVSQQTAARFMELSDTLGALGRGEKVGWCMEEEGEEEGAEDRY